MPPLEFNVTEPPAGSGLAPAIGDNATDNYAILQAQADWVRINQPGWMAFPGGNFLVSQPVVIRGEVSVRGAKFATHIKSVGANGVLVLDNTGTHCLRDIGLIGDQSLAPSGPTLETMAGSENFIDGVRCWHGAPALRNRGDDGTISNSFFWSRTCLVENYSTGWWKRVKFDNIGPQAPIIPNAFYCGLPSAENYFEQCDFTGPFNNSFMGAACTGAFFKFTNCIFSDWVDVTNVGHACFIGCTFSQYIVAGNTPIIVDGCYSFLPFGVSGTNKHMGKNINIW